MSVEVKYKSPENETLRTEIGLLNKFEVRFFDFKTNPLSFTGTAWLDRFEFEGALVSGRYNCEWDLYGQLLVCDAPFGIEKSGKLHIGEIIEKVKEIAI